MVKASGLAYFQYTAIVLKLAYTENKLHKTLGYSSRDMLNFVSVEKDLGIVYTPRFVYDFSGKMFLMLYFIN